MTDDQRDQVSDHNLLDALAKNIACADCGQCRQLLSFPCGHTICHSCRNKCQVIQEEAGGQIIKCRICSKSIDYDDIFSDTLINSLAAKTFNLREGIFEFNQQAMSQSWENMDEPSLNQMENYSEEKDLLSNEGDTLRNQFSQANTLVDRQEAENSESNNSVGVQTDFASETHCCCVKTNMKKIIQLDLCPVLTQVLKGFLKCAEFCKKSPIVCPQDQNIGNLNAEPTKEVEPSLSPKKSLGEISLNVSKESSFESRHSIQSVDVKIDETSNLSLEKNLINSNESIQEVKNSPLPTEDLTDQQIKSPFVENEILKDAIPVNRVDEENNQIESIQNIQSQVFVHMDGKEINSENIINNTINKRITRQKLEVQPLKSDRKRKISNNNASSDVQVNDDNNSTSNPKEANKKTKKTKVDTTIKLTEASFKKPKENVVQKRMSRSEFDSSKGKLDTSITEELKSPLRSSQRSKEASFPKEKPSYVILSANLSETEKNKLKRLSTIVDLELVSDYKSSITHLVVAPDSPKKDLFAKRSIKYLQALMGHKWIVSFDWVAASLKSNKLLDESPYEIRGIRSRKKGCPKKSRLEKKPFFANHVIYFNEPYPNFNGKTGIDELKKVICIGDGKVAESFEEMTELKKKYPKELTFVVVNDKDATQVTECSFALHRPINEFIDSISDLADL